MTPKRKKYLKRCSEREKYIREEIQIYKKSVKHWKHYLNVELPKILAKGEKPNLYDTPEEVRQAITHQTFQMKTYRHELNRLKGADRVVVPVLEYMEEDEGDGIIAQVDAWRCPKCGTFVGGYCWETSTYCMQCGRRILWEKVNVNVCC